MQTIETTSVAINTTSTAVTYTHAGVSTTNKNVTKLRFGNDASRYARIVANGDSDIDFFKLPYAMTAVEIAQHFIDTNYKADNLAVVDAINAVLTTKAKINKIKSDIVKSKTNKVAKVAKEDCTVATVSSTADLININGYLAKVGDTVHFKDENANEQFGELTSFADDLLSLSVVNNDAEVTEVLQFASDCYVK